MPHSNQHGIIRTGARRIMFAVAFALTFGLQGCASSLETFGLGAGVGIVSAFSALGCAVGCH
ncbi:hypothetical protein PQQ51_19270 [Paraburkholderia xenovorans]|uniref:hypothetical protein n=1 Tax=Paraburkholderia xenovorans TaxID=36873 RepID=UPI0038B767B1